MNHLLNKMERKFGRFAIKNLMKYIIGIYLIGGLFRIIAPNFYFMHLSLIVPAVLRGEIWRLVTFLFSPLLVETGGTDIFFFLLNLYFYWFVGGLLERTWGVFRFNLYYISGVILNILAAFLTYAVTKDPLSGFNFGIEYVNRSLLLAFCTLFPNVQVLVMFVIPVKVKYLGYFYAGMIGLNVLQAIGRGNYVFAVSVLISLLNFILFFFTSKNYTSPGEAWRKRKFRSEARKADILYRTSSGIARHKCAICGRTEKDDPNLEFRFCSKCEGNYEYCGDHLYTHRHIVKTKES